MTQYISDGSQNLTANPTRTDLVQNGQTLPPFAACDSLDKSISILDDWASNFIGRMQPYRQDLPTATMEHATIEAPLSDRSGLENRIYASSRRVEQIVQALDEMNQGLRL